MATISPDLQDLTERLEDLSLHPDNARRGDVSMIKASLEHFGQVRPIVCTDDGVIVAGNHTFRAAQELGWQEIAAVRVHMSEQEAEAYLLVDNRTADAATWDDVGLLAALERMQQSDLLQYTGFSVDDMEDLVSAIESVPETDPETFTGDYAEPEEVTAARWEGREEGKNKEVVFLLPEEDYNIFIERINNLKGRFGLTSYSRTIFAAVEFADAQAFKGMQGAGNGGKTIHDPA
jgi:hypothetical protein